MTPVSANNEHVSQAPAAVEVGQLALRLARGYYTHVAALRVATDPRAEQLAPLPNPGVSTSVHFVARKDGSEHVFDFRHFLRQARNDPELAADLERVWIAGALLTVGDALERNNYFDRSPTLELVRHLRNGVAHGNRFHLKNIQMLSAHPAHNGDALVRGDAKPYFEVTPSRHGQTVLFEFMGPADTLDLLTSVGLLLLHSHSA